MAREIVFSTTKELDYHFLHGRFKSEIDTFVSKTHNDIATTVFTEKIRPSFYIVKNFQSGCLFGAYIDVFSYAQEKLFDSEFATCIRGSLVGHEYPTFAFIGWFVDYDSKEYREQHYVNIPFDFFIWRLKSAFKSTFYRNADELVDDVIEVDLPTISNMYRHRLPYPEALVRKKVKQLSVDGDMENFVFNLMTNYLISSNLKNSSASIGLDNYLESFDIAVHGSSGTENIWLYEKTMNHLSAFDNFFGKKIDNIKVNAAAVKLIVKMARNNTYLFQNLLKEIGDFGRSRDMKTISESEVIEYFVPLGVERNGIQKFDIEVLLAVYNERKISSLFSYYSMPFLIKNEFLTIKDDHISITEKGYDVIYGLRLFLS